MTPKEKALELFELYSNYIKTFHQGSDYSIKIDSLICATIAVEEILSLYKTNWNIDNSYWQSVKEQLNNL